MLSKDQWTRVNQIHELVKQEGDWRCETAFDDLLGEIRHCYEDIKSLHESNLMWFNETKKAYRLLHDQDKNS